MKYIIHYDVAALFITITVFLHFFFKRNIRTRQTRIFFVLILCALISNISDLISLFSISDPGMFPKPIDYAVNMTYLITFNAVPVAYYTYILIATRGRKDLSKFDKIYILVPYTVATFLVLTTPLTDLIFYFNNDNNEYTHGPLLTYLYICAFYYVISALIKTIQYHKILTMQQLITVFFYTLSSLGALVLQLTIPGLMIVQFMVSISILLIYLSLENPEDYQDKSLGTYNSVAFMEVFTESTRAEHPFRVVGVQVMGLQYINEKVGLSAGNYLMKGIADFLISVSGKLKVYHMSGAKFCIMGNVSDEDWDKLILVINQHFKEPFIYERMEFALSASMCSLTYPENVTRLEDAIDMIDYSLMEATVQGDNAIVVYADRDILEKGHRENKLLSILRHAIVTRKFEVYYQPIMSKKDGRFVSAEALIRLRDEELGFISPEEFIPIAEKNGLILDIGTIVFKTVCQDYKSRNMEALGIQYLHVNLSVVECMQEKLYERLTSILDEAKVGYEHIHLEITETAAVASQETLKNNMSKLISKGFVFAMDDYGTGFSNTATLIHYPFETIKLDKSMIWGAMKDEQSMTVLKHSIAMIKDLNLSIVAEGVETKEQAEELFALGCDYIQGYYFSKPLCLSDFEKKISQ